MERKIKFSFAREEKGEREEPGNTNLSMNPQSLITQLSVSEADSYQAD